MSLHTGMHSANSPFEDEHREEQKVSHSRPKGWDTVDVTRL